LNETIEVQSLELVVGSGPPVPVTETSWSKIKAIYHAGADSD
jgi:hypothetical protein